MGAELPLIEEPALPVDSRSGVKGMEQEIIWRATNQENQSEKRK